MATAIDNPKALNSVQALVQLLRRRSYEEIRQRMYDNPPGSRMVDGLQDRTRHSQR